jgi:hypothetical protein
MKVKTDVKAGGLINLSAIVIVGLDLFGGRGNKCGGGCGGGCD